MLLAYLENNSSMNTESFSGAGIFLKTPKSRISVSTQLAQISASCLVLKVAVLRMPFLNIETRHELFRLIIEAIIILRIYINGVYNGLGKLV